jgi:hypothetical protein
MSKVIAVVVVVLVVVACAVPGGSGISGGSAPTVGQASEEPEWDRPADGSYELCPPDTEPKDKLTPGDAEPIQIGEINGFVRHGIVENSQGELFRVDVTGPDKDVVNGYADAVLVCFDHLFTGKVDPNDQEGEGGQDVPAPAVFGSNEGDLLIDVYLIGFVDPADPDSGQFVADVAGSPVAEWAGMLEQKEATPDVARKDEIGQDAIIDFVIDPKVSGGATHQYREKTATKVYVGLGVNSGRVIAGICRNGTSTSFYSTTPIKTREVAVSVGGLAPSASMSVSGSATYRFDVAVRGKPAGTYRLSGSYGFAYWYARYDDPPPTGGDKYCWP